MIVNTFSRDFAYFSFDNDDMDFWQRLKEETKAQGLTQAQLAEAASVPFRTLEGWISKRTMPNAIQIVSVAKVLGVSVEYLITGIHASTGPYEQAIRTRPMLRQVVNRLIDEPESNVQRLFPVIDSFLSGLADAPGTDHPLTKNA